MATRKFNGIEYPVPGVDTAIAILRPHARYAFTNLKDDDCFDAWEDDTGTTPPTRDEILKEVEREVEIYNYYLYERNREKAFPKMVDQLDMLYHDIKNGNLENGSWIQAIDEVKNRYPKPD